MEITLDLDEIREYVTSDKFKQFLTNSTTSFGISVFVLQTLLDKLDELEAN